MGLFIKTSFLSGNSALDLNLSLFNYRGIEDVKNPSEFPVSISFEFIREIGKPSVPFCRVSNKGHCHERFMIL